jgi:transposase
MRHCQQVKGCIRHRYGTKYSTFLLLERLENHSLAGEVHLISGQGQCCGDPAPGVMQNHTEGAYLAREVLRGHQKRRPFRRREREAMAFGIVQPRRRANKKRGPGTHANDRPPLVGTGGRRSGTGRLRVCKRTNRKTWPRHVETYPCEQAPWNSEEWTGDNPLHRCPVVVKHAAKEGDREDDGAGIREVHTNTRAGLWTSGRNFLRPFRGVHKKHLTNAIALWEHAIHLKRIAPTCIAPLVKVHSLLT